MMIPIRPLNIHIPILHLIVRCSFLWALQSVIWIVACVNLYFRQRLVPLVPIQSKQHAVRPLRHHLYFRVECVAHTEGDMKNCRSSNSISSSSSSSGSSGGGGGGGLEGCSCCGYCYFPNQNPPTTHSNGLNTHR